MRARYTPGPLEIVGSTIRDASGRKLAQTLPGGAFAMTPEQEANAALFAAAPALAEALAGIIGMINRHPDLTVADLTIAADIAREALTLAGLADDPAAAPCRTCGEPAGLHGIGCPEHLADLAGLEVERPDPWS